MSPEKKNQIREFIDSLNKQEQAWTNGYLDGILNGSSCYRVSDYQNWLRKIKKLRLPTELNPAIQKKLPIFCLPRKTGRYSCKNRESGSIPLNGSSERRIFSDGHQHAGRR